MQLGLGMGNTTTEGASYIHNRQGTFYLAISVANVPGYVVVIEQDITSIPEFSAIWAILAIVTTSVAILTRGDAGKRVVEQHRLRCCPASNNYT